MQNMQYHLLMIAKAVINVVNLEDKFDMISVIFLYIITLNEIKK